MFTLFIGVRAEPACKLYSGQKIVDNFLHAAMTRRRWLLYERCRDPHHHLDDINEDPAALTRGFEQDLRMAPGFKECSTVPWQETRS